MTKTVSLSDDAYEALAGLKRPGESFSDVALRLSRLAAQDALFDPEFRVELSDEEADAWVASVYEARDQAREPRTRFS